MFVYQDGKLYIQDGDYLVGVNVDADKITKVEEKTAYLVGSRAVSNLEVKTRFIGYRFPVKKEVEEETKIGVEVNGTNADTTPKRTYTKHGTKR